MRSTTQGAARWYPAYHSCSFVLLTIHSFQFPSVTIGWLLRTRAGGASPPQYHLPLWLHKHLICEHLHFKAAAIWLSVRAPCQPACAVSRSASRRPLHSHSSLCGCSCHVGSEETMSTCSGKASIAGTWLSRAKAFGEHSIATAHRPKMQPSSGMNAGRTHVGS